MDIKHTTIPHNLGLDLLPSINEKIYFQTKFYDKRVDLDFHFVNFPFLDTNIPSSPAYGVYMSQLIRYARACTVYTDFQNFDFKVAQSGLSE